MDHGDWKITNYWYIHFAEREQRIFVFLEKKTNIYELGLPRQITDILLIPELNTEDISLIPDLCMQNGVFDSQIFVIAALGSNDRFAENSSIQQAWRVNLEAESFESLAINGIECYADNAFHIILE